MKTKTLITILLVAIVLMSCAPAATSVPPTETAVPTVTFTVPAPTPTKIPATPTEAGLSIEDYLAKSENIFPMLEVNGLAEFTCLGDFDNIIYKHYTTPDGTTVKAWVTCEDGGVQFLIPIFLENDVMQYITLSIRVIIKKNDPVKSEASDAAVKKRIANILKTLGLTGKTKIIVLIGRNSGSILTFDDPFPSIFAATGWDKTIQEFILTGDPNKLPSIDGLPGKALFGVRIKGSN